jgi:excisionase family DNA binding protein
VNQTWIQERKILMTNREKQQGPAVAPGLMTVQEAAHYLHLSADDVRDLIERGVLAGRETRNGMRLNRADVEAHHAQAHKTSGESERTA